MERPPDYEFEVLTKDSPFQQYIAFHNYAIEKYGPKALIVSQFGDFYEMYGEGDEGADLKQLSRALDYEISVKNQRVGFNKIMLDVCIQILLKHYTPVILVDEVDTEVQGSKKRKIRRITRVYTKETYTDSSSYLSEKAEAKLARNVTQSNNLALISHIYVRILPTPPPKGGGPYGTITPLIIAISSISIEDGSSDLYEVNNANDNPDSIFDDVTGYFVRHRSGLVLYHLRVTGRRSDEEIEAVRKRLLSCLPTTGKVEERANYSSHYFKLDYQLQFIEKLYPSTSRGGGLERLSLDRKPEAVVVFIFLLQYIYEKYPRLLEQLALPRILENERFVTISVDAVNQLSLYDDVNREKSVYDIINVAKTAMGSRLLLSRLLYPIVDATELERRYAWIDYFLSENRWEQIEALLDGFVDLDKYHRKFTLGTISPANVVLLLANYGQVRRIYKKCQGDIFPPNFKADFLRLIDAISVVKTSAENYSMRAEYAHENIFVKGYDRKLDALEAELTSYTGAQETIISALEERIAPKNGKKPSAKVAGDMISMLVDIKDGTYHLEMTPTRFAKLRDSLREEEVAVGGEGRVYHFDAESFRKAGNKRSKKGVTTDQLDELGAKYIVAVKKLTNRTKKMYKKFVDSVAKEYAEIMRQVARSIAEVDFFMALAKIATKNNYCRPRLDLFAAKGEDDFGSSLSATKLRHPIVEHEISQVYVPHSIILGKDAAAEGASGEGEEIASGNIILLYGPNECGKSTLLRAVGTSVILAQMGSFVPAESFEFRPFKSLYTRILTKDNIQRGRSAFKVEMLETIPTLTRCDEFSLFLADEPCHSTNHDEQIALVAAFIKKWGKMRLTCLITTHVYELAEIEKVVSTPGVGIYHLSAEKKGTKVVYRRQLRKGVGERSIALDVARAAGVPLDVIEEAERIKRERRDIAEEFLSFKRSNYSSKLYMDVMCEICGKRKATETHHVRPQKDADERGFIGHIPIHAVGNLQRLCKKCHAKITFDK